ncbi:MAG: hypothetical protein V3T86_09720, partial [Planctomycetota bacterium]
MSRLILPILFACATGCSCESDEATPEREAVEEPETERERELREICARIAPGLEKLLGGTVGPVRVLVRPTPYFQNALRAAYAAQASPAEWSAFSKLWQKLEILPAGFDFAEEYAAAARVGGFYDPVRDVVAITERSAAL